VVVAHIVIHLKRDFRGPTSGNDFLRFIKGHRKRLLGEDALRLF